MLCANFPKVNLTVSCSFNIVHDMYCLISTKHYSMHTKTLSKNQNKQVHYSNRRSSGKTITQSIHKVQGDSDTSYAKSMTSNPSESTSQANFGKVEAHGQPQFCPSPKPPLCERTVQSCPREACWKCATYTALLYSRFIHVLYKKNVVWRIKLCTLYCLHVTQPSTSKIESSTVLFSQQFFWYYCYTSTTNCNKHITNLCIIIIAFCSFVIVFLLKKQVNLSVYTLAWSSHNNYYVYGCPKACLKWYLLLHHFICVYIFLWCSVAKPQNLFDLLTSTTPPSRGSGDNSK